MIKTKESNRLLADKKIDVQHLKRSDDDEQKNCHVDSTFSVSSQKYRRITQLHYNMLIVNHY